MSRRQYQPELMTPMEVAVRLAVHANTVKRIPADELPYMRFGHRGDRRYRPADVSLYIEQRMVRKERPDAPDPR